MCWADYDEDDIIAICGGLLEPTEEDRKRWKESLEKRIEEIKNDPNWNTHKTINF